MATGNKLGGGLTALILVLLTVLIVPAAWYLIWGLNFIAVMVLMVAFVMILGKRISGRFAGILINERNLMSLSRFQTVLWTVIILSAFVTIAIERVRKGNADALSIQLDWQLWALMGISTASLIGTPLIQSTKTNQDPKAGETDKTAAALNEDPGAVKGNSQGTLYANADISHAAFSDMFEGDEIGNTAYVDLGKVQMFFFTMIAALSYGAILFHTIVQTGAVPDLLAKNPFPFPMLSQGFIALLGISHAGYLVNKSTDHTQTK